MELATSLEIQLPFSKKKKKSFLNVFGSLEVENVIVIPATGKYWDKLYKLITIFLYIILRDFYEFH